MADRGRGGLPLGTHVLPGRARGKASTVVLGPRSVCGRVVNARAVNDALPELDRDPLVEDAHGQGYPSPALDRARRGVRAVEPALSASIVLVAGEHGAMDRELGGCKGSAVIG